jgi:hypothetical protein
VSHFTLREQAYLILARKISFNKNQKVQVENQKIAKAFAKPKFNAEGSFTERKQDTVRVANSILRPSKGLLKSAGHDTQRAFQHIDMPRDSFHGDASMGYKNFQNIIDLSNVKKTNFQP